MRKVPTEREQDFTYNSKYIIIAELTIHRTTIQSITSRYTYVSCLCAFLDLTSLHALNVFNGQPCHRYDAFHGLNVINKNYILYLYK